MHSITLNICAYILLFANVITIVILLKKQFKQWKSTPLYILSVSDVLFSIFTSSILLIICVEQVTYTSNNNVNNTFFNDSMWNEENDYENQWVKLIRFTKNVNSTISQTNFDVIPKCNIINVIVKYGILFFPFTNSFVSLLMFSVQCNLNVFNLKNQCFKFLQSEEKICKDNISIEKFHNKTQCDSMTKQNFKKILQIFKCNEIRKDKKSISIFVISQWIIPIIVTGLLYLSEYDRNYTENMENTKCFIESIFLLDECHNNVQPISITQNTSSEMYATSPYKNYVDNEDLTRLQNSNATQVNEIINKIQNIVYSILNDTSAISFNMISYNVSEPINMIEYLKPDADSKIIEQNKSLENELNLTKNISLIKYKNSENSIGVKNNTHLQNNAQLNNYSDEYNEELLFFNELTINSTNFTMKEENHKHNITTDTTEKLHFKESETDVNITEGILDNSMNVTIKHNTSVMSNDQIYAEIVTRIHNTPIHHIFQNYYNKKQLREVESKKNFQHNSTLDTQNVLSAIKMIIYQNDNASKIMQVHVTDKCFIPIQFLKLHLLVIVFIIYFLPILFSLTLQQHGKLNCQIILEKLRVKNKMSLDNFMQHLETYQENYNKGCDENYKSTQHYISSFDEKDVQLNMINQVGNMLKLFDTIKMSLLSGTLLWTPLFSEFLVEVFTFLHIPQWLINTTFFAAIAFGVLRNIFNLKMIKLQEINTTIAKINSVHPIT
ncbi:hypothetical protein WH47_07878 [Habropoda laboriosa]|uniref:Uncharacterized protein n=1 Tax=Habropoda laboriosa TaxID=597456 RepID=A0A0L7RG29_9HYME|nr:hypothetical protein WH47_07878 [Habropoda laboriosa]